MIELLLEFYRDNSEIVLGLVSLVGAVYFFVLLGRQFKKKIRLQLYFYGLILVVVIPSFLFNRLELVAGLAGILAAINRLILQWFFPPIIKIDILDAQTTDSHGLNMKYFHLWVKNEGFTEAKNLRVKIRDNNAKNWVNLRRPFPFMNLRTEISTLSSGEDESFDIGYCRQDNFFFIETEPSPYNQRLRLDKDETHSYFLSVVADNADPLHFTIDITNSGYNNINITNFNLKK